jgi:hypothetical protein
MKGGNWGKKQCCSSDLLDPDPTRSVNPRIHGKTAKMAHKINPGLTLSIWD